MTTATKHGLGRGLDALIPQRSPAEGAAAEGIRQVQIAQIEPNPGQPRKHFAPGALDELTASIQEHGLLQPLLVREIQSPYGSRYQIIAGERRWRAAQRAGLTVIPVIIKGVTPQQMLEIALVENVQRADLNVLETAEAYQQLIQDFEMTQEQVATKVGKDRTTISNALRLLKMSPPLKEAVLNEELTEGHARALMQLTDAAQQNALLHQVIESHLSVRQTEELVRRTLAATASAEQSNNSAPKSGVMHPSSVSRQPSSPDTESLEQDLRRALGTKVELYRSQRGGKIVIEFYSDEELDAIYSKLVDN